jgi:hypothetical protein
MRKQSVSIRVKRDGSVRSLERSQERVTTLLIGEVTTSEIVASIAALENLVVSAQQGAS